jgi:hypothetical protein
MRIYLTTLTLAGLVALSNACGGTETASTGNTANTNAVNTATAANANHPLMTTKTPEAATTNNAPTLGPVVQAYYDALKKKDDAAVRETMSTEFLKSIESDMKEEKKTNLAAFLAETDDPNTPIEVRNEKMEGDKGVAEVRGGVYKNWTAIAFGKENGKWKLTGGSPEIESVKQSAGAK